MTFSFVENEKSAKIKVVGVGGAGGNAINNMINSKLSGVKFIVTNTDSQALEISSASMKIQLGVNLTEGLGAGANPEIGKNAAIESKNEIRSVLGDDSHMIFITAGLGGGTGTGAAPIIAEICKELGALTVAVVTKPFTFEGKKRMRQAEEGMNILKEIADTVITIPNDRIRELAAKNATMIEMFKKADEVLLHSVKGITDLIMLPGLVNLDFADIKTIMNKAGMAIMGIGQASGEDRAMIAAEKAISHPLLEDISISGAKGVLMNISSASTLTMEEMTKASDHIYREVGDEADIIWGAVIDESMGDKMSVTVIATGIGTSSIEESIEQKNLELTTKTIKPVKKREEPVPEQMQDTLDTYRRIKRDSDRFSGATYKGIYQNLKFDEVNYDTPTFLRKRQIRK